MKDQIKAYYAGLVGDDHDCVVFATSYGQAQRAVELLMKDLCRPVAYTDTRARRAPEHDHLATERRPNKCYSLEYLEVA